MKRLSGTLGIGLALVWSLVILMTGTPQVRAQTSPNTSTAPNALYLPLIAGGASTSNIKTRSGIHMGNRNTDWQDAFFARLRGKVEGDWPAAVVVQSDQLYTLHRSTTNPCRVSDAIVKSQNLYSYLTSAITQTIIVIRITPAPGNFIDYASVGITLPHTLLTNEVPAGGDYCGADQSQKSAKYRDILDLAQEMDAIYQLNVNTYKWPKEHIYFEPANEPNNEWYAERRPLTRTLAPDVDNKQAWIDMDNYFAALYDRAKQINPNLQILASSISQGLRGEHTLPGTCDNSNMTVDANDRTGLDFMKQTYGYDFDGDPTHPPAIKADGFAWHNYWREGQEAWEPLPGLVPSLDAICPGNRSYLPKSDHLYQYFSAGMEVSMARSHKPTFITEADLQSPCQNLENTIKSKDQLPDGSNDAYRTRDSLIKFVSQEFGARYVIAWLLVNQFADEANKCGKDYPNHEINWHEAYTENGDEHFWFTLWWHDAQ
ncbi:MAG: hypothetical protein U0350_14075 [Caldilineaceae bacterium]